jgi:hypothetical protein
MVLDLTEDNKAKSVAEKSASLHRLAIAQQSPTSLKGLRRALILTYPSSQGPRSTDYG